MRLLKVQLYPHLRYRDSFTEAQQLRAHCPVYATGRYRQSPMHFYTAVAELQRFHRGHFHSIPVQCYNVHMYSGPASTPVFVGESPPGAFSLNTGAMLQRAHVFWSGHYSRFCGRIATTPQCVPNINGRLVVMRGLLTWEWGVNYGAHFLHLVSWKQAFAFEILYPDLYSRV